MDDKRLAVKAKKDKLLEGPMGPEDELALVDLGVEEAGLDERDTMFNPTVAPKPPDSSAEATMRGDGTGPVDMQADSPMVEDMASFDLDTGDLFDIDL